MDEYQSQSIIGSKNSDEISMCAGILILFQAVLLVQWDIFFSRQEKEGFAIVL
jgi:hypothetical protein